MTRLTRAQRRRHRHVPRVDRRRARVHVVGWLPPGTSAMTLGRRVLVRREHRNDEALLAHELVHVRQWRELGVAVFLWCYLRAYFAGRIARHGHWASYAAIPLEEEARALTGC